MNPEELDQAIHRYRKPTTLQRIAEYSFIAMLGIGCVSLALYLSACSSLTSSSPSVPNGALSEPTLMAECVAKGSATRQWLACTALSEITLLCSQTKAGSPVDMLLVAAIQGYANDPVLGGLGAAAGNVAITVAANYCVAQGY